jgi:hypothetical protein
MSHSIGSRSSLADLDGVFSCFVGLSGYLSSGLGLLCCAAPGNTNTPNARDIANIKAMRVQAGAFLRLLTRVCEQNVAWSMLGNLPAWLASNEAHFIMSDVITAHNCSICIGIIHSRVFIIVTRSKIKVRVSHPSRVLCGRMGILTVPTSSTIVSFQHHRRLVD